MRNWISLKCLFAVAISVQASCAFGSTFGASNSPVLDSLVYPRDSILERVAELLNERIPTVGDRNEFGFQVTGKRLIGFTVHDLVDTQNHSMRNSRRLSLLIDHVYHAVPLFKDIAFSFIVIVDKNSFVVFEALNCDNGGDSIENVIDYLVSEKKTVLNVPGIIGRIKNYRHFGHYLKGDNYTKLDCSLYIK